MSAISQNRSNCSVLIVDDEPGMRTALEANFLLHGWRVETATGVHDAARAIGNKTFDLVVSDIRMRDGDGFEVLCSVLKNSPATAVILLTAFGSVPQAVESMRSGAFDYLTKPISFEQLQATAARVMRRVSEKAAPGKPANNNVTPTGTIRGDYRPFAFAAADAATRTRRRRYRCRCIDRSRKWYWKRTSGKTHP